MNSVAGSYFAGRLAFVSLHTTNLSSAWIAYRYNMLADADQSDFFGTWSWTATGGGGSVVPLLQRMQLNMSLYRPTAWDKFVSKTPISLLKE